VTTGAPTPFGNLQIWPLFSGVGVLELLTLGQAIKGRHFKIGEVSDTGHVGELQATNRGRLPVFLLDGEQVLGLKQNRAFNLSMVVPPKSSITVPVSCLERGRWSSGGSRAKLAQHVHFASGRAQKVASVSANLVGSHTFASDQRGVWNDISSRIHERQVTAPREAEADYFEAIAGPVEGALAAIPTAEGQIGVAIGVEGDILGLELFGSPALYQDLAPKILRSYAAEAFGPAQDGSLFGLGIGKLVSHLIKYEPSRFAAPGGGETLRWRTRRVNAAALTHAGKFVHLVAFPG
jgi:hypothetical protein